MTAHRVVVAGGGLAAVRTAQALRDLGHRGSLTVLSAESELPYDRPPLSKDHLLGTVPGEALHLVPATAYADLGIDLRLDSEVVALDPAGHTVDLADGTAVPYDRLVVATGARARSLPVFDGRPGAAPLRTAEDSRRLAAVVAGGGRVVVVGGGFIGLEVAATARGRGCRVTVVEAQPMPLLAAVGQDMAAWLQAQHAARGVEFRCGVTVTAAADAPGGGERLALSDGSTLDADAVVVGVGVVRDVAWLAAAGLEVADGLVCDADGRTALPDVFGAGDVVCHRTERGPVPNGHWTAAGTSARRVAHAVLDLEVPPLPDDGFFWSDQYDLKLQFVGRVEPASEFTVVDGDLGSSSFVARYRSADRTTAVVAVSSPRAFMRERIALRKAAAESPVAGVTG